jgi:hypothetical protein
MLDTSESIKFKGLCTDIGLAVGSISVYLANCNARQEREAKLNELKILVEVQPSFDFEGKTVIRRRISTLLKELGIA